MQKRRRFDREEIGNVTVVTLLDPKILDEQNVEVIFEQLFDLVEQGKTNMLIDCVRVEFYSAAAMTKLITLHQRCSRRGKLALCNVAPEIYEVFQICKLDKLFNVQKDREAGLAQFA